MVNIDDYEQLSECDYKGEHYSVRDNGAIMRHPLEGKRPRPSDNEWTFGKPNIKTGYMEICGKPVHRIVAFAFLGNPPTDKHIVDHIDTNRRNNRPENLRWLTRLENVLNNPITRKKIIGLCGSIEAFIENPSLLRGHENMDKNFSWMRQVSKEEAKISLQLLTEWAESLTSPKGDGFGEWIFHSPSNHSTQNTYSTVSHNKAKHNPLLEDWQKPMEVQSLTPNAIQVDWRYPVEFPCCPQVSLNNPLEAYMLNLKPGGAFSKNKCGESIILDCAMPNKEALWVMCKVSIAWKTHAITKITFKDGLFYHENMGAYDAGDNPIALFDSIKYQIS